ncbi:MAG TPA: aminotransferase class V-fold PLP-dependent enzyme [Longimicrobiales bacterium]|nr:aminotransferase class V-fold PLP-dependent enzyme [Longimicrobiales bacterium]
MTSHFLDYAATSALRPPEVTEAVRAYLDETGATAGRGGYGRALDAGRRVLRARRAVHGVLGLPGDPSRLTFSANATMSLNHVLHRALRPGDALVVTDFDHNAVLRPAAWLERHRDIRVRHVHGLRDGTLDRRALARALDGARLLSINAVSNVLGTRLPVADLVDEAHSAGALALVDTAQAAGHVPVDWGNADFVAFTGHKGLLGPQGTGGLWVRPGLELEPLLAGGTGGNSLDREMPAAWPDHLEAGTLNGPGIAGLGAGATWVEDRGVARLHQRTATLKMRLRDGLAQIPTVDVLSPPAVDGGAIVTIRSSTVDAATLARDLDREHGIEVRAGLHCAPEVHRLLGTTATGAVRYSLGWASTDQDVDAAVEGTARVVRASRVAL